MSALPAEKSSHAVRILLIAGILIGFALRLFRLGAESFWYDETVSVHLAQKPLLEMIVHTARDIHPPGYYALLHLWQSATSPSLAHGLEFLYAWPSVVAGMVVLVLVYALGRRLFDASTGLIALWLAAFNPFQLWYSQEVRMYTVGAALALLSLWAALSVAERRHAWQWLVVYIVSAAAGLYTLYYFAFWLVGVNIAFLIILILSQNRQNRIRWSAIWLAAQAGVLALFGPWLPIVVRQVVEPPVPPWRTPWSDAGAIAASLAEASGALLAGQSPPTSIYWPWSLATAAIVLVFAMWALRRHVPARRRTGAMVVLVTILAPLALLFLITALVTPIYHVRYVFLYAPLFLLMPAALLAALWRTKQWLAIALFALVLIAETTAAVDFWTNPRHRADDHRSAVAAIAAQWRPGDVILANAGWIYPVLTTYWPDDAIGGVGSVQLDKVRDLGTLVGYTNNTNNLSLPGFVRTGSIDGPDSLGWNDPASDFYAISAAETADALRTIADDAARIWHYRLYDTVNDSQGVIRTWLEENANKLAESPIPGRDFGLVQLYETPASSLSPSSSSSIICFGGTTCLHDYAQDIQIEAGRILYLDTLWSATDAPSNLATSLRLYDDSGRVVAQADAAFLPQPKTWPPATSRRQSLALPIGASTKPGSYSLELIVYRQETGEVLPVPADTPAIDGQRVKLGSIEVMTPNRVPELPAPLTTFDYIDLIQAQFDRTTAQPGEPLLATFFWRPRPARYQDTYEVIITLRDQRGAAAQTFTFTLGGDSYPSGDWRPLLPVRDFYELPLAENLTPGEYELFVGLTRASDGAVIRTRGGLISQDEFPIGSLIIETPQ